MNRDASLRCVKLAKQALANGDREKARRLLAKGVRLDTEGVNGEAREMLRTLDSSSDSGRSRGSESSSSTSSGAHGTSTRRPNHESSSSGGADRGSYTPAQKRHVDRIVACEKDYYEVLQIDKSASDVQIKKGYRKLALLVHPDKNQAPNSEHAFKVVGEAFATLSDKRRRQIYDLHGPEAERQMNSGGGRGGGMHPGFRGAGGVDLTPEEIFQMFFGGGFPGSGVRTYSFGANGMRYRGQPRQEHRHRGPSAHHPHTRPPRSQEESARSLLFQVLMMFGVMLLAMWFFRGGVESYYSLSRQRGFPEERLTSMRNLPYFVTRGFDTDTKTLRKIEQHVEQTWKSEYTRACQNELRERTNEIRYHQYSWSSTKDDDVRKARARPYRYCPTLQEKFGISISYP